MRGQGQGSYSISNPCSDGIWITLQSPSPNPPQICDGDLLPTMQNVFTIQHPERNVTNDPPNWQIIKQPPLLYHQQHVSSSCGQHILFVAQTMLANITGEENGGIKFSSTRSPVWPTKNKLSWWDLNFLGTAENSDCRNILVANNKINCYCVMVNGSICCH